MSERGNTGFGKIHEIASRMIEADPAHANGWEEVITFVDFSARQGRISKAAQDPLHEYIKADKLTFFRCKYFDFDFEGHAVVIEGEKVHLTKQNLDLLKYLIERRNKTVSTDEISDEVWENYASKTTIAVHIHGLRKTLKAGRDIPDIIETVRGVGYKFAADEIEPKNT